MPQDRFSRRSHPTDYEQHGTIVEGFVTSREPIDAGTEPTVSVQPTGGRPKLLAKVDHAVASDVGVPPKGTKVHLLSREDSDPIIVGVIADDHDGYTERRRFDHPFSDGYVEFREDGTLHIEADGDVTIVASGDVTIEGIDFDSHVHNDPDKGQTGGPKNP